MKAIERFFHAVLFIMLYKAPGFNLNSLYKTLVCDQDSENAPRHPNIYKTPKKNKIYEASREFLHCLNVNEILAVNQC